MCDSFCFNHVNLFVQLQRKGLKMTKRASFSPMWCFCTSDPVFQQLVQLRLQVTSCHLQVDSIFVFVYVIREGRSGVSNCAIISF